MKAILFAAALGLSTMAVAQATDETTTSDTDTTMQPSGETVDDSSQSTGPEGETQQGTDPNGTGQAPAGSNQSMDSGNMSTSGNMGNMPTGQAMTEYPPCSRTVTDRCIQTYERGVRRGRGRR